MHKFALLTLPTATYTLQVIAPFGGAFPETGEIEVKWDASTTTARDLIIRLQHGDVNNGTRVPDLEYAAKNAAGRAVVKTGLKSCGGCWVQIETVGLGFGEWGYSTLWTGEGGPVVAEVVEVPKEEPKDVVKEPSEEPKDDGKLKEQKDQQKDEPKEEEPKVKELDAATIESIVAKVVEEIQRFLASDTQDLTTLVQTLAGMVKGYIGEGDNPNLFADIIGHVNEYLKDKTDMEVIAEVVKEIEAYIKGKDLKELLNEIEAVVGKIPDDVIDFVVKPDGGNGSGSENGSGPGSGSNGSGAGSGSGSGSSGNGSNSPTTGADADDDGTISDSEQDLPEIDGADMYNISKVLVVGAVAMLAVF